METDEVLLTEAKVSPKNDAGTYELGPSQGCGGSSLNERPYSLHHISFQREAFLPLLDPHPPLSAIMQNNLYTCQDGFDFQGQ